MHTQPYLRGDDRKQKFLDLNPVRCSEHSALFPGEELKCCCGDKINNEYYCFSYEENFDKNFYANGLKMKAIHFPVLEMRIQKIGERSNL